MILQFGPTPPKPLPPDHCDRPIIGRTHKDLLDGWHTREHHGWGSHAGAGETPLEFRQWLVWQNELDIELPASDQEILEALVVAWGGDLILIER